LALGLHEGKIMSIRKSVLTLVLAALAFPSISFAQHEHRATVLLRSGERVAGVLEDVENNTVFVRVSLHDQRKLPVDQVALIDFVGGASGLPDTELSVARGSNHVALLRGGESMQGRFADIRGGETENAEEPHALIFRTTAGEERRVSLDNVARIYFGNFPTTTTADSSPGASAGDPLPAGAIRVPGNSAWVATPLTVRKGDMVVFNVSGQIQLSSDANDVAVSAGSLTQRRAANSPLPQNLAGALIARVGNSAPFPIGNVTTPVTMPADGQLYLGVNDDEVGDNRGEFIVRMTRQRR
jgi:hypothetical protein